MYPLKELWSMVSASTGIVKIGIIPQTNSLYDCDTWTIADFIQLDTQDFPRMQVIIMVQMSQNTA